MTEISQISTSWNAIRATIEGKLDFVCDSFLTGSYIRRTKISPIDDLDIFFKVDAGWTNYQWTSSSKNECKIYITTAYPALHKLYAYSTLENGIYWVSPTKIMNEIKRKIAEKYSTTPDISRNGEAVTVYLSSYGLTIDCVPSIEVNREEFIFIPTSGNNLRWKKTNPKIDKSRIDSLDDVAHFNGKLKWIIKLMKYWNKRKNTWMKFRSYALECRIYQILKTKTNFADGYADILREVIKGIYNDTSYNFVSDIPGYAYIQHSYTEDQWSRIKGLLETMWQKLNVSEDDFITYLKS